MRKNSLGFVQILVVVLFLAGLASVGAYYLVVQKAKVASPPTSSPSVSTAFCGGIAGLRCPEGYGCQLDGNYPDASGKCIRMAKVTGKVTIGPTCPVEREGQTCTAPYVGEIAIGTLVPNDAKLGRWDEIVRFKTADDGSFQVYLPPGNFFAKRLDVSNNLLNWSKTQIVIEGDNSVTVDFQFDTGIR